MSAGPVLNGELEAEIQAFSRVMAKFVDDTMGGMPTIIVTSVMMRTLVAVYLSRSGGPGHPANFEALIDASDKLLNFAHENERRGPVT